MSITSETREDILWWQEFILTWNGVSIIRCPPVTSDDFTLFTDTSGALGFGVVYRSVGSRARGLLTWSIIPSTLKNCVPLSFQRRHRVILGGMDRFSSCLTSLSAGNLSPLRISISCVCFVFFFFFFYAAKFNFNTFQHIPGHTNYFAALLSRLQVHKFPQAAPDTDSVPLLFHLSFGPSNQFVTPFLCLFFGS